MCHAYKIHTFVSLSLSVAWHLQCFVSKAIICVQEIYNLDSTEKYGEHNKQNKGRECEAQILKRHRQQQQTQESKVRICVPQSINRLFYLCVSDRHTQHQIHIFFRLKKKIEGRICCHHFKQVLLWRK